MDGKVLNMPDIIKFKGMSKESKDFKNSMMGSKLFGQVLAFFVNAYLSNWNAISDQFSKVY